MSAAGKKNNTFLYFLLLVLAIWLGWKVLLAAYYALSYAGLNAVLALDLSAYGQLAASRWPGYAVLGAGLGAAGGAIAARRRFGLGWPVETLGWAAIVLLLGLVYATTEAETTTENTTAVTAWPAAPATTAAPTPAAPAQPIIKYAPAPDTSSTAAEGWQQVIVRAAPLRASWVNSSTKPFAYLHAGDTVQLVRRAHAWVRVSSPAGVGWVRRASLGPLAEEDEPTPTEEEAPTPPIQPGATLAKAPAKAKPAARPDTTAPAPVAAARPVGHRQCGGTVDNLAVTYSLDFQKTGLLSGYYYYQQQPGKVYRLTGSLTPAGELQLLEFTRGRQSARCVLQRQGSGYAGTKYSAAGGQATMTLTLN